MSHYAGHCCTHGCATCKPAIMRRLSRAGATTIFVGDGLSDRCAAECADIVFAKKSLELYCRERELAHVAYEELGKVAAYMESLLRTGTLDVSETAEAIKT